MRPGETRVSFLEKNPWYKTSWLKNVSFSAFLHLIILVPISSALGSPFYKRCLWISYSRRNICPFLNMSVPIAVNHLRSLYWIPVKLVKSPAQPVLARISPGKFLPLLPGCLAAALYHSAAHRAQAAARAASEGLKSKSTVGWSAECDAFSGRRVLLQPMRRTRFNQL